MLKILIKIMQPACLGLLSMIFDFLTECVQGPCTMNQNMLAKLKIIEYCKDLIEDYHLKIYLGHNEWTQENKRELSNLIRQSIKFLNSMLEGNTNLTYKFDIARIFKWKFIINHLKIEFLKYYECTYQISEEQICSQSYKKLMMLEKTPAFSEDLCETFYIYFFIKNINTGTSAFAKKISSLSGIELFIFNFFEYFSAFVELDFKGQLEVVYFIKHPACMYLDEEMKNEIIENVNRSNRFAKISYFLSKFNFLFDKMEYFSDFAHKRVNMFINNKLLNVFRLICLLLNILICGIYFVFDKKVIKQNVSYSNFDIYIDNNKTILLIVNLLLFCYVIATMLLLICWLYIYLPVVRMENWNSKFLAYKRQLLKKKTLTNHEEMILFYLQKNVYQLEDSEHRAIIRHFFEVPTNIKHYDRLISFIVDLKFMYNCKSLYIMLLNFYFAAMGYFVHMIFIALNLFISVSVSLSVLLFRYHDGL